MTRSKSCFPVAFACSDETTCIYNIDGLIDNSYDNYHKTPQSILVHNMQELSVRRIFMQ